MAIPRCVVPGRTYLVTRRCIDRRYLITPSAIVDLILIYCLAVAALRFGIEVHGFVFLSNHHHIVLTDHYGKLPRFSHWFHSIVARFLNAHYGRLECFWAPGSYSAVHLVDADDVLDKLAYVLANPVAAGLVDTGTSWPGVISHPRDLLEGGAVYAAKRPKFFFSPRTKLPAEAVLKITCPPDLADLPHEVVVQELTERREVKELAARERMEELGIPFLGRKAILAQSPLDRPRRREPRFRLSPNIACRDRWKRVERLQELNSFRVEYRECYLRIRNGDRSVVFPEGTWGPVMLYGAKAREVPRPRAA